MLMAHVIIFKCIKNRRSDMHHQFSFKHLTTMTTKDNENLHLEFPFTLLLIIKSHSKMSTALLKPTHLRVQTIV